MPAWYRFANIVSLSIAGVLQAGCASVTGPVTYPLSWPPLDHVQAANSCPSISGTFSNRASASWPPAASDIATLADIFARMANGPGDFNPRAAGRSWSVPSSAKSITFQIEPERLQVTFSDASETAYTLSFRRYHFDPSETKFDDQFTCYSDGDSPRLRFFAESESHSSANPPLYIEGGGTLVFLLRAVDGSLVVQLRSDSLGISSIVLGTRMKFNSMWLRFSPMGSNQ